MASTTQKPEAAIEGAGISGLAAAYELIKAGYEVHIHDPKNRTGGIIETFHREDGRIADRAAEFIDSDQHAIIQLCNELGVKLIPTQDQNQMKLTWLTKAGRVLPEEQFNKEYRPIAEQVVADKEIIKRDPTGIRAHHLDSLSMPQYIAELATNANAVDTRPFWKKWFTAKPEAVAADVIDAVIQGFGSERGRPADRLSALQFVQEAGASPDNFIASDCMYRVEGGTKTLIDALEKDLRAKGAHFHFGEKATKVDKQGNKYTLEFNDKSEALQTFDKVVFAAQGYNLAAVQGLDKVGFSAEDQDTLKTLQYSHNTKITVKTKAPIPHDGFFLSNAGYQTWNRDHRSVVFYIGGDLPNKYPPQQLLNFVMQDYARAHNTTVDQFFDTTQINFNGPNVQNACCAAPAPGQSLKLQKLADSFDRLAEQGIGVVGTYVPQHIPGDRACGYMGNGIESVNRAISIMVEQNKSQQNSIAQQLGLSPRSQQGYVGLLNNSPVMALSR